MTDVDTQSQQSPFVHAAGTAVLTDLEQATPEWLTETLQKSGALLSGCVIGVEQTPVNDSWQVAHLRLIDLVLNYLVR